MGDKRKTRKLVQKLLKDENKRALYTKEELQYMEIQLARMKVERARRKLQRKLNKGFGYIKKP